MSLGSFFKSIKKKITLKGAVKAVTTVGAALPIVGGVIGAIGNNIAAGKQAATQAQAEAQQQYDTSAATGTVPAVANAPPTRGEFPWAWVVIGGVGLLLAFYLSKRH